MSLQQEHQEWQEQKAKQALDNSYNILEERNIAVPVKETLETAVWCSTRGSDVSRVLGNVPKNLQHLVRNLRDQIQQTSQATSTELVEQAKERSNFPEATIDVIINICQGKSEIIIPVKEVSKGIAERIYAGCNEVVQQQKVLIYENSYNSYAVIQLDAIVDHQYLGARIKEGLDARLRSYNLTVNVATNFSFEHAYDKEPAKIEKRPQPRVVHDPDNKIITVQPPERNGKVKFLPIDPRIKADIVQMIKNGEDYQAIRDRYKPLSDQGQLPDSRLSCYKSHITMKTY